MERTNVYMCYCGYTVLLVTFAADDLTLSAVDYYSSLNILKHFIYYSTILVEMMCWPGPFCRKKATQFAT